MCHTDDIIIMTGLNKDHLSQFPIEFPFHQNVMVAFTYVFFRSSKTKTDHNGF